MDLGGLVRELGEAGLVLVPLCSISGSGYLLAGSAQGWGHPQRLAPPGQRVLDGDYGGQQVQRY